MTDIADYRRQHRPVHLDGDILVPRREFARGISVSDRTASRMGLPTVYLANTAFVMRDASLKIVTGAVRHRNTKPPSA